MEIKTGFVGRTERLRNTARAVVASPVVQKPLQLMDNWRQVTLNEAMVEIPQAVLDLSNLSSTSPILGGVAQTGISALAFKRAAQGLSGSSFEARMEGASSLALGIAGTLSLFPGQIATTTSQAFMGVQGALEMSLGVRELHEEFFNKEKPAWKEVATGALDTVKGATSLLPLIVPSTANAVNAFQITALVSKALLESSLDRY